MTKKKQVWHLCAMVPGVVARSLQAVPVQLCRVCAKTCSYLKPTGFLSGTAAGTKPAVVFPVSLLRATPQRAAVDQETTEHVPTARELQPSRSSAGDESDVNGLRCTLLLGTVSSPCVKATGRLLKGRRRGDGMRTTRSRTVSLPTAILQIKAVSLVDAASWAAARKGGFTDPLPRFLASQVVEKRLYFNFKEAEPAHRCDSLPPLDVVGSCWTSLARGDPLQLPRLAA